MRGCGTRCSRVIDNVEWHSWNRCAIVGMYLFYVEMCAEFFFKRTVQLVLNAWYSCGVFYWWQNSSTAIVVTSNKISINALQWILLPPTKKMSGWVVRTYPPMTKLVFWKLLEKSFPLGVLLRDFCQGCLSLSRMFIPCMLLECFESSHLPESFFRVYIWVRKYGTAVLAGPIVMITAHRWRNNHDVSGPRWRLSGGYLGGSTASIYDFKYRGCVRRPEKTWNVLSNVSCIKDECQFRRLGRQCRQSYLFYCGRKWIRRIASI